MMQRNTRPGIGNIMVKIGVSGGRSCSGKGISTTPGNEYSDHIYVDRQKALRKMEREREKKKLPKKMGKMWKELMAEKHCLLPKGQMGNRRQRSTELAIRLVTEAVRTAWTSGAIASLLQLDIKGAFDTVSGGAAWERNRLRR